MDYKIILGVVATLIGLVGYAIYFKEIFTKKIIPHAFSWLVWGILTSIAFAAQVVENGGAGAWNTGVTGLFCLIISVIGFTKGRKDFTKFDWICLITALIAIVLWWFTKNPTLSVILVTTIDAIGCFPTIRKSFHKPFEENATIFALSSSKFIIALFALETYTLATWLYPVSLVITNVIMMSVIIIRRMQLKN